MITLECIDFKFKKNIKAYLKELYERRHKGAEIDPLDIDWSFLSDLLERHPDVECKKGVGISKFVLGSNPLHQNIELQVWRIDGTYVPFNPDECISGKIKSDNKLSEAMREAVECQINHFRNLNKKPIICPNCGRSCDKYHVDHVVSFKSLSDAFIKSYGRVDKFIQLDNFRWAFSDEVVEYSSEWQDFHSKYAILKWLCDKCNMSKGAK